MRITTYRELQSKDQLLPLFQHVFWWPFNPKEFEKTIKADPRLKNSPVGYAALEKKRLIGFVGVMDIVTRTLPGLAEEDVGGIWGVVTDPAHARKGIFKALMQRSHAYFEEKGYRFSLLNTGKSLIAYAFYQKLGYRDGTIYPSAYKIIKKPKKPHTKKDRKTKLDWSRVLKIFTQATQDRTGFVIRDASYRKMLETRKRVQSDKCIMTDNGYALLKEDKGNVTVQEIIASTKEEMSKLITGIEDKATKIVIAEAVLDKDLQSAYLSQEFMILEDSYDVLMYKPLANEGFTEVYGNRFYAAATDYF